MIKKSISVTQQQDAWIQSQLASGDFASDSEVIRAAIRLKQKEVEEIDFLRARLDSARKAGLIEQEPEEILAEFKRELRREGTL